VPLAQLVIHAAVMGFAEVAGLSGAAHAMALGLWVAPPNPAAFGAAAFGAGLAAVVATRARLVPAVAGAMFAFSRPASFFTQPRAREALVFVWMAVVSAGLWLALRGAGALPPPSPHTLAIGLGATGIALLLAGFARDRREPPPEVSFAVATLAGAAHAFGAWPGASRVGLCAAVLIAVGTRPARALALALVASIPSWWADFALSLPDAGALGTGRMLLVVLFAFLGSLGAMAVHRALLQRRAIVVLSLWMIPLSGAIFAYSRAV
jgi:undecaprenyl pyrophosphate phosphatase UppP